MNAGRMMAARSFSRAGVKMSGDKHTNNAFNRSPSYDGIGGSGGPAGEDVENMA